MTTFLLDIWHDLREKRLWPIAVALVAATVAVPVLLVKPAEVPPADTAPPAAKPAALPTVSSDPAIVDTSALDTFDIKDPFGSQADTTAGSTPGADAAGTGSGAGGGGGGEAGSSDAGSDAGGSGDAAGSAGGGGGGSAGGGGGDGSGGGTRYFTYTVDVRFGPRGDRKAYKGMSTLDLLPNDQNPIVSFMGMRDNAKTAVFFIVDPSFEADGEGECAPSEDDCRFIYLGVDDDKDEETLSAADGNLEYELQLDRINIKRLSEAEAEGDAQPDTTPSQSRKLTKAQRKRRRQHTLLTVPLASRR